MGLPPGRSAVEGLLRTGCGRGVAGLLLAVPLTVTLGGALVALGGALVALGGALVALGGALVALGGALGAGPLPRVRPLLMVIGVATMFEY